MANDSSQNIDQSHVRFGKNMAINTSMRLPQFDNGTALAYQAYNPSDKSKSYIALISGAENIPCWTTVPAYNSLAETSFIRLMGSGIVNWKLDGEQKYAFIYVNNMGKPLLGADNVSSSHWNNQDVINYFIRPMVSILAEMQEKSFAHGSVRPSNIFYSSSGQNAPIILGDGLSVYSGSTQPSIFLPPYKAMAEPMGRGHASVADDTYAFGISLFMLLSKNNSLLSLDDDKIFRKKMEVGTYAALIGNERFQVSFLELLRGVLHDDDKLRWGVEDISLWIDGARATPPSLTKRRKANRPFVFSGNKYLFTESLALDLHKNPIETAAMVSDGSLEQWVTKSIDDDALTERYLKALERVMGLGDVKNNKDYLVAQLRFAFCPSLPIYYKDRCFTYCGLGAMMVESLYNGKKLSFYEDVLRLNLLDHSLVGAHMAQGDMIAMLKSFDVCRSALRQKGKYGYGIEKCIYMMCKNAPCLSPKLKGYFVNSGKSLLSAIEKISKGGKGKPIVIDTHLAAFFSVQDNGLMDRYLSELSSGNKDTQIFANLAILSAMQRKSNGALYVSIAAVFEKSLSGVYKTFRNTKMRETIKDGVKSAAKKGSLSDMLDILKDKRALTLDQKGFQIASYEYRNLHNEYNEYNKRLAHKASYGVVDGHSAAVIVSWSISITLTAFVVLAFLSGNQIF